jgi:GTPase
MRLPVVAIVGRPNVGKSTLFNRVAGRGLAVVDDEPGITRDRHYAVIEWAGSRFHLVDTGGWVPKGGQEIDRRILEQILVALMECDLVLFLVDAAAGLQPHDVEIAREIQKRGRPLLLVANKVDTDRREADAAEFAALGLDGVPWSVSAIQGRGVGEVLDEITRRIPKGDGERAETEAVRIAVMGKPNVGKSSLVNRLLGEERMIVDDVPGTTRDAVDTPLRFHGRPMVLVDTAGIRRKLSAQPDFEFYATLRAIRSLETAHVALLVFDATDPFSRQDLRIARMIDESGCACVWVFNKWDLVEKDDKTSAHLLTRVREQIPFQSYAPAEFISALTVQRVSKIPQRVLEVYEAARRRIPTGELNACVRQAVERNRPRAMGGERPIRIYYATQVKVAPPTFALFVSRPERLAQDYARYLVRELRRSFDFAGSPIRLQVRKST